MRQRTGPNTRPVELAMRTQGQPRGRLKLLVTCGGCHSADVRATSRARMSASRSATAARCASVLAVRWARSAADRSASISPVERGKPQLSMNTTGLFRSSPPTGGGYIIVLPDDTGVYTPGLLHQVDGPGDPQEPQDRAAPKASPE